MTDDIDDMQMIDNSTRRAMRKQLKRRDYVYPKKARRSASKRLKRRFLPKHRQRHEPTDGDMTLGR